MAYVQLTDWRRDMVHTTNRLALRRLLLAAVAVLVALSVFPSAAFADRRLSVNRVDIDATVSTDGSVSVTEMREFEFDGSYNGVYWKIPTGEYDGRQIEASITGAGIYEDGEYVPFSQSLTGDNGTYEVEKFPTYVRVKLYSPHSNETARLVIHYRDTNLAGRFEDTGELNWKFVSDGWDMSSNNVTCTVHLPVAAGEAVVPGDNVRAWGHGPLDASVAFDGNDVVYTVPGVGTSEFAEARIVFPAQWLSAAEVLPGAKLDNILSEEQRWADEANARREAARMVGFAFFGISVGLAVITLAVAFAKRVAYKKAHTPQFDDTYFRDVPTDDHPAVLGALYHDESPRSEDLTAALMQLTDKGYIRLDKVKLKSKGTFGREKLSEDFRLTIVRDVPTSARDLVSVIDSATIDFLRGTARLGGKDAEALDMGDLKKIAKKHAESYNSLYESWKSLVVGTAITRNFFTDEMAKGKGWLFALAILNFGAVAGLFFAAVEEIIAITLFLGAAAACAVAGVAALAIASSMKKLSPEAVEVIAKLHALKRWLEEFTRLGEAVPHDVVLWNKLLVMAVVLGVSEKVIAQLKMVAPEVLDDPYLAPVYGWYYYGGMGAPARAFSDAIGSAHEVSTAALASSSNSSGGGGGGGFSGGGGGGFGGGGGGGGF